MITTLYLTRSTTCDVQVQGLSSPGAVLCVVSSQARFALARAHARSSAQTPIERGFAGDGGVARPLGPACCTGSGLATAGPPLAAPPLRRAVSAGDDDVGASSTPGRSTAESSSRPSVTSPPASSGLRAAPPSGPPSAPPSTPPSALPSAA